MGARTRADLSDLLLLFRIRKGEKGPFGEWVALSYDTTSLVRM